MPTTGTLCCSAWATIGQGSVAARPRNARTSRRLMPFSNPNRWFEPGTTLRLPGSNTGRKLGQPRFDLSGRDATLPQGVRPLERMPARSDISAEGECFGCVVSADRYSHEEEVAIVQRAELHVLEYDLGVVIWGDDRDAGSLAALA